MFSDFVTKTKADGTIVIDKDRSFFALIEALEPLYEELVNANNFDNTMQELFSNPNQLIDLVATGDDIEGYIHAGMVY